MQVRETRTQKNLHKNVGEKKVTFQKFRAYEKKCKILLKETTTITTTIIIIIIIKPILHNYLANIYMYECANI